MPTPQFADVTAGDYSLGIGSPCIDAGLPHVTTTNTDALGGHRPIMSAWDMGALEYLPYELPHSGEDVALEVNGFAENVFVHVPPGSLLSTRLHSPVGSQIGAPAILGVQLFNAIQPQGTGWAQYPQAPPRSHDACPHVPLRLRSRADLRQPGRLPKRTHLVRAHPSISHQSRHPRPGLHARHERRKRHLRSVERPTT